LSVIVLVGLHLASRWPYFKSTFKSLRRGGGRNLVSRKVLLGVAGLWIFMVSTSLFGLPPASQIINTSFEARHRATIFRSDPQTVYKPVKDGFRLKRVTDSDASILIQLEWGRKMLKKYNNPGKESMSSRPQMAIWAEGETGSLIETLYLSETSAFNETFDWGGHQQRRVDVLPIWRNRFTLTTGIAPDGKQAAFFSGATPKHSFSIQNYLKTDSKPFYLYVEINVPGDPNTYYNAKHQPDEPGYTKPGIGQPSVIYAAHVDPSSKKQYLLLDLVGQGGSNTSDGSIHYNLDHLTSAKNLVEKILVRVKSIDPQGKGMKAESNS